MSNIILSVRNIYKSYDNYDKPVDKLIEILFKKNNVRKIKILKDISFELERGKTLAILGTNGAGKSTLLQCIAGTLPITAGSIEIHGRLTALLELGAGFNHELTGRDNIYLSASLMGLSKNEVESIIDDVINFADIEEYIDKPVYEYSSGMYVRLAFSIASHTNPDIMIIDEALSVGDIFFQQKCNLYMKNDLSQVTKLIVSHDLSYISRMADEVILLHDGSVYYHGDPLNAIEKYLQLNQSTDEILINRKKKILLENGLIQVDKSELSGQLDCYITSVCVTINQQDDKDTAYVNDEVKIIITLFAAEEIKEPIIGYFINDKFGTTICGETNKEIDITISKFEKNRSYSVSLTFLWPNIRDDDYFLNIGIGDGNEPFNHVIQCWYMNFKTIRGITKNGSTHGIFNNNIEDFYVREI